MMIKLKRCPFCGEKVDFNYNIELEPDGVYCKNCKMLVRWTREQMKPRETFGDVCERLATRWNRRANNDSN